MRRQRLTNQYWTGLLFISPWLLGFFIWVLFPIVYSIYLSFCMYDGMTRPVFTGLDNFRQLAGDERFWKSLWNTGYIIVLGLPIGLLFSLLLAFLLNQKRRGIGLYRTLIYMPSLTPLVASSVLWMWIFNPEVGLLNHLLKKINALLVLLDLEFLQFPMLNWLNGPLTAKPALIIMGLWGAGGTMLIFLASLQDVPRSLYESADLDGASWLRKQWHITLPLISPILFYNLLVGIIGGFQYFTQSYVVSNGTGSPQDSTLFYALYLFNNAFPYWKMGYASAMAWVLFFITLACSYLTFRLSAKHIFFQGE